MRLKTCGALASVALYGVFPYLLGCNSPVAGEDCPSFKEATDACKDEGKCWEYRRGGDEALNLELGVDTVKGSGQGAASCDVVCSNCSDMVAPVEVPLPETNLEKDVLSLARAVRTLVRV